MGVGVGACWGRVDMSMCMCAAYVKAYVCVLCARVCGAGYDCVAMD